MFEIAKETFERTQHEKTRNNSQAQKIKQGLIQEQSQTQKQQQQQVISCCTQKTLKKKVYRQYNKVQRIQVLIQEQTSITTAANFLFPKKKMVRNTQQGYFLNKAIKCLTRNNQELREFVYSRT